MCKSKEINDKHHQNADLWAFRQKGETFHYTLTQTISIPLTKGMQLR